MNTHVVPSSTKEVHHDEVENDVGEDEISKGSLRTNSGKLGLIGRINLEIRNGWIIIALSIK